jgi:hypothetical protein
LDTYKTFSALNGTSVWQIGQNSLLEFSNSCPGLLNSSYDFNGVVLQTKGIVGNLADKEERTKNRNKNVPENIIRHQFMALLVKIVKDKYMVRTKTYNTLMETLNISFESHYIPVLNENNIHKWRIDKYYTEYVDNVIKAYLPILDAVFKSFGRKEPGRKE